MEDLFAILLAGQYLASIIITTSTIYSAVYAEELNNDSMKVLFVLAEVALALYAFIKMTGTSHLGQVWVRGDCCQLSFA
jgi:hypothetical protein